MVRIEVLAKRTGAGKDGPDQQAHAENQLGCSGSPPGSQWREESLRGGNSFAWRVSLLIDRSGDHGSKRMRGEEGRWIGALQSALDPARRLS